MTTAAPPRAPKHRTLLTLAACMATMLLFHALYGRYFPLDGRYAGSDYALMLPELLAGRYWQLANGLLSTPWFTPAFCGGVPFFPDPQSIHFSLPQLLAYVVSPMNAVHLTALVFVGLGFLGTHLLLSRAFALSPIASFLGALAFALNGFFSSRMVIGHLAFHAFMLLPLIAALLLSRPARPNRLREASVVIGLGLAGACMVHAGMLVILLPTLFTLLAVLLLHRAWATAPGHQAHPIPWSRIALAGGLTLALSAHKLVAAFAMLSQFDRTDYPLPGMSTLAASALLAFRSVFLPGTATAEYATANLTNSQWQLEPHELDFGLGPVTGLVLIVGLLTGLFGGHLRRVNRPFLLVLVLVTAIPIALNFHTPGWHDLLKSIPILNASSSLFRWYVVYLPVGALLLALVIHRSPDRWQRWCGAPIALAMVLSVAYRAPDAYLGAPYDVTAIESASESPESAPPPVTFVQVPLAPLPPRLAFALRAPNDGLVAGVSNVGCYDPIFGYRLEHLVRGNLRAGPPDAVHDGRLNFRNPACDVWPEANQCAPGDPFQARENLELARLLAYRPHDFVMPLAQRVANAISGLALALVLMHGLLVVVVGAVRLSGRLRARPQTQKAPD